MAQATSIILADALATPVNHTFTPVGPQKDGFFAFEDQSASSPVGYNRIEVRGRRTGNTSSGDAGSRSYRIELRVKTPKLETIATSDSGFTPPPRVAYVPAVEVSFVISDRGTLQDRKDIRKYISGLLANSQIVDLIESQVPLW